jgi:hypothetical protein
LNLVCVGRFSFLLNPWSDQNLFWSRVLFLCLGPLDYDPALAVARTCFYRVQFDLSRFHFLAVPVPFFFCAVLILRCLEFPVRHVSSSQSSLRMQGLGVQATGTVLLLSLLFSPDVWSAADPSFGSLVGSRSEFSIQSRLSCLAQSSLFLPEVCSCCRFRSPFF